MEPALDTRSRDLLLLLLDSKITLTAKELGEPLGLTQREVHYWIQKTNIWLNQQGISIEKQPGAGLSLNCSEEKRKSLQRELENLKSYALILKPIERQRFLILTLLTDEQPVLTKSVAVSLGVSRPTIFDDMQIIEKWLKKYDLKLISKRGYGFIVNGKEIDFRKAIESILIDIIGEIGLLSLHQGNFSQALSNHGSKKGIPYQNLKTHQFQDLPFCCDLVGIIEEKSNYYFSDSSYLSMILFFSILLERVRRGKFIGETLDKSAVIRDSKEYEITDEISELVYERYSIKLDERERFNIAIRIMGLKKRQSTSIVQTETQSVLDDDEIEKMVRDMIDEASKYLHPILTIDQKLFQGLFIHIKPVINRLYFGLPIKNYLLNEIKEQYPYIFMIAEKSGSVIEQRMNVNLPEDEIGFMAMHLGAAMERLRAFTLKRKKNVLVVCGGGCATAWMLVSRIQAEFPEINIVDVKSILELSADPLIVEKADFVITTVIPEKILKPVLLVSPLLGDTDIARIRKHLDLLAGEMDAGKVIMRESQSSQSIMSLLDDRNVQTKLSGSNWQDVVDLACKPLIESHSITPRYVEAIKELLIKHGPYMVISQGVVLLHAMVGDGVNEVCMSMATIDPPVKFGHKKNDPISLAIVFGTVDNRSHLRALGQLARMLGEKEFISTLVKIGSGQEIIAHIQKFIDRQN